VPSQNTTPKQIRRWAKFDPTSAEFQTAVKEIVGQTFQKWTVLAFGERRFRSLHWLCRCVCGTERLVAETALRKGHARSCGCDRNEGKSAECLRRIEHYREWSKRRLRSIADNPELAAQLLKQAQEALPTLRCGYSDRIGEKLSFLLVERVWAKLHVTKKHGQPRFIWFADCLCDCGKRKTLRADRVFSGRVKSCSCYRERLKFRHETEDHSTLVGTQIDRWTVLSLLIQNGRSMVECRCQCGRIRVFRLQHLLDKIRVSCRCVHSDKAKAETIARIKALAGRRFHHLTVEQVFIDEERRLKSKLWCICDCGNHISATARALLQDETKSCGCQVPYGQHLKTHGLSGTREYAALRRAIRDATIQEAIGNGDCFTPSDILEMYEAQNGLCNNPYCHKKLHYKFHIDHVIPLAKGGTSKRENIQLLCRRCNEIKNDLMPDQWLAMIEKHGGKNYRTRRERERDRKVRLFKASQCTLQF
jgi:5-methylcytosine-specific restriction endonuclease McrA